VSRRRRRYGYWLGGGGGGGGGGDLSHTLTRALSLGLEEEAEEHAIEKKTSG
jgi:hypothetical protein